MIINPLKGEYLTDCSLINQYSKKNNVKPIKYKNILKKKLFSNNLIIYKNILKKKLFSNNLIINVVNDLFYNEY